MKIPRGQFVIVYDNHRDKMTLKKFLPKWFGLYIVMKVFFENITYELAHLDGEEYGKINHDKLKLSIMFKLLWGCSYKISAGIDVTTK